MADDGADVSVVPIKKRKRPPLRQKDQAAAADDGVDGGDDDTLAALQGTRALQRLRGQRRAPEDGAGEAAAAAAGEEGANAAKKRRLVVPGAPGESVKSLGSSFETSHGDQSRLISKQDAERKAAFVQQALGADGAPAAEVKKPAAEVLAPADSVLLLDRSLLSTTQKKVTGLDIEDGLSELALPMSYGLKASRATEDAKKRTKGSPSPPPDRRSPTPDKHSTHSFFSDMPVRRGRGGNDAQAAEKRVFSVRNTYAT